MYCGAAMPEPSAAPSEPPPRRELPKDLDKAFQRAMQHGDMRQLRDVLGGVESRPVTVTAVPPRPTVRPVPSVAPPSSAGAVLDLPAEALDPLPEVAPAPPEPSAPPPPSIDERLALLRQAETRAQRWEDDPPAAAAVLREARELLDGLIVQLDQLEGPPELLLPPFRQPWALFVAPPADEGRLHAVAQALEVDLATARQIALLGYPRAALRTPDRADLERRAAGYRRTLDLPARVLDQGALRAQPAARLVLTLDGAGPWRSAVSGTWEPDSGALASLPTRDEHAPELRLVVVGEVVVTRFRELRGRRKDDGRVSSHGGRRLGVIDLHHDAGVLRVVEGISRLQGWRGLDPRSSALAFRGLPEALAARFPLIPHTARCVCRPTRRPEVRDDGRLEAAGWPAWEEHSRACRCLYLD